MSAAVDWAAVLDQREPTLPWFFHEDAEGPAEAAAWLMGLWAACCAMADELSLPAGGVWTLVSAAMSCDLPPRPTPMDIAMGAVRSALRALCELRVT